MKPIKEQAQQVLTNIKIGSTGDSERFGIVWGQVGEKYTLSVKGQEVSNKTALEMIMKEINKNIFNLISDFDFPPFNDLEIWPIANISNDPDNTECETTTEDQAIFYSLYIHLVEGGIQCIADLPTKAEAENLRVFICRLIKALNPTEKWIYKYLAV